MSAVERGTRLRATVTDRTYRVGRIDDGETTVFAPPEGDCRCFAVRTSELVEDIDAGRIEVIEARAETATEDKAQASLTGAPVATDGGRSP